MEKSDILKIFDEELVKHIDKLIFNEVEYWDLRCGVTRGTSIEFTDQKSKEISSYEINKCGIRTFKNGGWGFYVLNDITKDSILEAFKRAIKLAKFSESFTTTKFKIKERDPEQESYVLNEKESIMGIGIEEKVKIVKNHDKIASQYSNKIKNTKTIYSDGITSGLFLNSFGSNISIKVPLIRMFCLAFAKEDGIIQRSVNSVGGLGGFEIMKTEKANKISRKSAKEAVDLLNAKSPVGGKFSVIMDPKLTGVFIHEAFGHAVEADHVLGGESVLKDKLGKKIAKENVTIVDDPRIGQNRTLNLPYELFGSYFIDSEGIPAQETILVEKGILKNYLHNLETASRMGVKPNGHGRATSPSSRPQVRMGITILKPGDWSLEEIIEDTKNGILCKDFQYGYTDTTTGNFQFKCKQSYRIENGERKELMRDVSLSGMTLEVLKRITALGKEISYSDGMCGKSGQSVRVCDGGPYIRVKDVTVGGLS
jgi:TldD protein